MKTYVRFLAATVAALYLQQQEGIAAAPVGNDQLRCHEFPVVIVSAESGSFPDPTCNQLRFPAEDCLKEAVVSKIEVIDNKDGSPNCFEAPPTAEYRAKTNYRGQTSLFFPKHQLGVKFGDNEAFLGLPEDKNFVLNGPYLDCTLLRNHLAHYLFRSTGRYSSRSRHVAMYFSDKPGTPPQYSGIYLLLEKMSYGPNRVGLAKMDGRCQGKELTGGWAWHNDPASYGDFSPNLVVDQYQNEFGMGERPVLAHPSGEATSQVMRDYFVNTTTGFLPQYYRFLWNNMTNPDGLEQHIDLGSFADYILHTEMSLNVDAYRRSTYFFKDRDQPINAGPVWDLNLAYGNGARRHFKDWIYPQYTYWKRLLCNYKLTSLMIQRWKMMRSEGQPWSDAAITSFLDESAQPIRRQLSKCTGPWQTNVLQCASVDVLNCNGTYESRLDDLKSSVLGRARWMDERITDLYKKLDGKTCSFVGEIPKYNCAANGDDDGCLKEPAKYYNAVQFPAIRKPFSGPECGAQIKHTMDNYQMTEQEKPSVDNCWLSSGVRAIYPNEKGVRDKNLTEFCGGYGTCQQGPGAKCECHNGIDLEPGSCRRIDAEYKSIKAAEAAKLNSPLRGMNTESKTTSNTNHAVLSVSVGLLVVGAIVLAVLKTQRRKQTPPPLHLSSPRAAGYGAIHTATWPRHV